MNISRDRRLRRARRTRFQLKHRGDGLPRLSVHRSLKHIRAQVIDDRTGRTVAAASTLETEFRESAARSGDRAAAERIGSRIAERALAAGISEIVFDRGAYLYHGRVRALADAARAAGLKF